jgi:PncC family amidohydrolase
MATSDLEIIKKVHRVFRTKGLRLTVAESCTAGLISHMLTSLPGASEFFDSCIVCYSARSKNKLLGVKKSLIKKYGTVSEETARAMAEAVRAKIGADVSLAVTGNLGPEPIEDKQTGLVFIAVSSEDETTSRGFIFDGSREEIKRAASLEAFHLLYEAVSAWT